MVHGAWLVDGQEHVCVCVCVCERECVVCIDKTQAPLVLFVEPANHAAGSQSRRPSPVTGPYRIGWGGPMRRDTHSTWAAGPATTSLPTAATHAHTHQRPTTGSLWYQARCLGVEQPVSASCGYCSIQACTHGDTLCKGGTTTTASVLSFTRPRPAWPRASSPQRHPNVSGAGCTSAAHVYLPPQRHPPLPIRTPSPRLACERVWVQSPAWLCSSHSPQLACRHTVTSLLAPRPAAGSSAAMLLVDTGWPLTPRRTNHPT